MKPIGRYAAYFAFAVGTATVWIWYFDFLIFRSLSDPSCRESCPPTTLDNWVLAISVILAIPVTVLAFVLFQRLMRRVLGTPDDR